MPHPGVLRRAGARIFVHTETEEPEERRPLRAEPSRTTLVGLVFVSRLKPEDRAAVRSIARAVWADMDIESELEKSCARLWVARTTEEGEAIAFLLAWSVVDELHVLWVATLPEHRRRRAARAVLEAAIAYASEERLRMVLLEVRKDNRAAIRLYRSAGFHAIGVRRGYYANDAQDAILMTLMLDPETGNVQPGRDEVLLAEA